MLPLSGDCGGARTLVCDSDALRKELKSTPPSGARYSDAMRPISDGVMRNPECCSAYSQGIG